jgi:hypothetical protein
MDANRFDSLARFLTQATPSRRRLLTGLAGSTLATLATTLRFAKTGATHFGCLHVGKRCKDKSQCCSGRCKHGRCRAHNVGRCTAAKDVCLTGKAGCGGGSCTCFRTTGGANFCSDSLSIVCMACTTDTECATALDTPGSACIDINHGSCDCTGSGGGTTICAKPCTA